MVFFSFEGQNQRDNFLRNQLRVGVNIPQRNALTHFSDQTSQILLTKSPEASSKTFIRCILYKTSLISLHFIGLKLKNNQIFCQKIILLSSKGGLATTTIP